VLIAAAGAGIYLRPGEEKEETKARDKIASIQQHDGPEPKAVSDENEGHVPAKEEDVKAIGAVKKIDVLIQSDPKEAVIFIEGLGQVCSRAPCNIELEEGKPVEIKAQVKNRSSKLVFTPSPQNKEILLKIEEKKTGKRRPGRRPTKKPPKPGDSTGTPTEKKPKDGLKIPDIFSEG
jgi:hypothetical protein